MNQTCKVCGEPAAGFHFGAFTCEGCKSFFGRSYNNLSSISDCKNNGECIINKKNRTACKACRLRKCLLVGMSKSGSRYGRRSNWFKIHCLLTQQQQQQQSQHTLSSASEETSPTIPTTSSNGTNLRVGIVTPPTFGVSPYPALYAPRTKEELMMLGIEVYKHAAPSPAVSSLDSHNSENSGVEVRLPNTLNPLAQQMSKDLSPFLQLPYFPTLMPPPSFLPPPSPLLFPSYHSVLYQQQQQQQTFVRHLIRATTSQRSISGGTEPIETLKVDTLKKSYLPNGSEIAEELTKCFYLEAIIKSQQQTTNNGQTDKAETPDNSVDDSEKKQSPSKQLFLSMIPPRSPTIKLELKRHIDQDNPIDLSLKVCSSVISKCSLSDENDAARQSITSKDFNDDQKEEVIKIAKILKRAEKKNCMPYSKRFRPYQQSEIKNSDNNDVTQVTKLNTKPLDLRTKL